MTRTLTTLALHSCTPLRFTSESHQDVACSISSSTHLLAGKSIMACVESQNLIAYESDLNRISESDCLQIWSDTQVGISSQKNLIAWKSDRLKIWKSDRLKIWNSRECMAPH